MTLRWNDGCTILRWARHCSPSLVMRPFPSRMATRSIPTPLVIIGAAHPPARGGHGPDAKAPRCARCSAGETHPERVAVDFEIADQRG